MVIIALGVLIPAKAFSWTFIQDSVRVDQGVAGEYAGGPGIAVCPNGNFVLVWGRFSASVSDAVIRYYDNSGNPITDQILVDSHPPMTYQGYTGGIICNSSNEVFVSWNDDRLGITDVRIKKFDSSGNPLGPSIIADQATVDMVAIVIPYLALGANDSVIIHYNYCEGVSCNWFRRFDSNLNPLQDDTQVDEPANPGTGTRVSSDPTGRFFLDFNKYLHFYEPDGSLRPGSVWMGPIFGWLVYNKYGYFAHAWIEDIGFGDDRPFVITYDGDGVAQGVPQQVTTFLSESRGIGADKFGDFWVLYDDQNDNRELFARRVLWQTGAPTGPMIPVRSFSLPGVFTAVIDFLPDGKMVVVWREMKDDAAGDIYMSLLDDPVNLVPTLGTVGMSVLIVLLAIIMLVTIARKRATGNPA